MPDALPTPLVDSNDAPCYGPVASALHGLLALMILGSVCVGLSMTGLPLSPLRL